MSAATTLATDAVAGWLRLDAGDPACNDARTFVDGLGREVQQDAARRTSELHLPLADTAAHSADDGAIADALHDLRRVLDSLDPAELATKPSVFGRAVSRIPGVGSPASRYAKRLASSRPQLTSILDRLKSGRDVLSRDNVTLRADQQRLHELVASVEREIDIARAFDDALVFAIDVELPFGDLRRPLFEDDLLVTVRERTADLMRTVEVGQHGVAAIESAMGENRAMIRGLDRARDLALAAIAGASTAGAPAARQIDAFEEVDSALDEVERLRREAVPTMERTVRDVTT